MRPTERYIQDWVRGSSQLVPNRDGTECLALGQLDTTGAVIITPQTPQYGGFTSFVLSARSPFIGGIDGPYLVTPYMGNDPLAADSYIRTAGQPLPLLDLLVYTKEPTIMPRRATQMFTGVPSASALYFRVRGRKRVIIAVRSTASVVNTITAYHQWGSGSGEVVAIDAKTATGTLLVWQPNPNMQGDGSTDPGFDLIDYIKVETAGTFASVSLQAEDE